MFCQKLVRVSERPGYGRTVVEKVMLEIIQVVVMAYRQNSCFTESFYYNKKLAWKKVGLLYWNCDNSTWLSTWINWLQMFVGFFICRQWIRMQFQSGNQLMTLLLPFGSRTTKCWCQQVGFWCSWQRSENSMEFWIIHMCFGSICKALKNIVVVGLYINMAEV